MIDIETLEKQLTSQVNTHVKVADDFMKEGQIWNLISIILTFGATIFTLFSGHISAEWFIIIIKIYTGAVTPFVTAISIWRNCLQNENVNRKLATAKRNIVETIVEERLKKEELREHPDDFYDKIVTMINIIDRFSY